VGSGQAHESGQPAGAAPPHPRGSRPRCARSRTARAGARPSGCGEAVAVRGPGDAAVSGERGEARVEGGVADAAGGAQVREGHGTDGPGQGGGDALVHGVAGSADAPRSMTSSARASPRRASSSATAGTDGAAAALRPRHAAARVATYEAGPGLLEWHAQRGPPGPRRTSSRGRSPSCRPDRIR
jgi:hypothetical protein